METISRGRLRASAVVVSAALTLGLPAAVRAQLFPNAPARKRERPPVFMEPPFYGYVRHNFYGYFPTCWRRFPPGWACPCPNPDAPNLAASRTEFPVDQENYLVREMQGDIRGEIQGYIGAEMYNRIREETGLKMYNQMRKELGLPPVDELPPEFGLPSGGGGSSPDEEAPLPEPMLPEERSPFEQPDLRQEGPPSLNRDPRPRGLGPATRLETPAPSPMASSAGDRDSLVPTDRPVPPALPTLPPVGGDSTVPPLILPEEPPLPNVAPIHSVQPQPVQPPGLPTALPESVFDPEPVSVLPAMPPAVAPARRGFLGNLFGGLAERKRR